ncbi:MAG: DUF4149 domain-containing protein [Planctomycetota bacterium]|jgi:hypothetical protein
MLNAVARLPLALWIGAVAGVAFVVAPRVFGFLDDHAQAGELMGPIFGRIDLFGIAAALVFAVAARASRWRLLTSLGLGALAAIDVFVLAPEIRARGEHLELAHQLSTGLWSVILIGGVVLLVAGPTLRSRAPDAH